MSAVLDDPPLVSEDMSTPQFWSDLFQKRPDILHQLLGDVYVITKAHKNGSRRTQGGGRPGRTGEGSLDDLWKLMTPRFSSSPFPEAVKELMGTQSMRGFATKVGMHHQTLQRLITGERPITRLYDPIGSMQTLEQIAKGAKVHPSYFVEWRRLWLLQRIDQALEAHPQVSMGLFSRYVGIENKR